MPEPVRVTGGKHAGPAERPYDLVLTDVRAVTPAGVIRGGVAVRDGVLLRFLSAEELPRAARTVDGGGRYLLPGLIDSHVHFRTPGLTYKEDWEHGSRAAAAGGVTTVIDMPNTLPPLLDPADAARKAAMVQGRSLVDYRFHLGVAGGDPSPLLDATPREATSVKVFLAGHHTAPTVVRDPASLARIFGYARESGLRLVLHAEDDGVFELLDNWTGAPGRYLDYERVRPRSGAIVAVAKVLELVRRHGTAVHVLHVSTAEEADLLAAAAHAGLPVTFEVTPHHLSFTAADSARIGARARLSPAIRHERDQRRLWEAVLAGQATTIGSDHAPHTREEKLRPVADAPPGLPGVQEMLPAVFTGMRRHAPWQSPGTHLELIARLLAANPADLFGIDGRKGRLLPGLDADFVLFDADTPWMVTGAAMHSKCGWSAYEGWTMAGQVRLTVRRGQIIYDADAPGTFGPPDGRWLDAARPATPAHPTQGAVR
ncbi:dihydroorotase family protein [Actinacidiphila oryziradicis]|uniref:dihydroorotase n=1 Tax=Actinacidiphila oryziradicis TaxID=2571141 RepID=UPI0023F18752|nr:dihydroorotase family protein [Actinacidiphila oryziradicis]MCW2872261.1 dihydroorotase [Actinacidiphila oryziradicis]